MVKVFSQNPKDAGSSPAWHYSFPCIRLLQREFIIYSKDLEILIEQAIEERQRQLSKWIV